MHLIGRRNFLNGLGLGAGAYLLGPMFKTLLPEALGQTTGTKRLIIYVNTYGHKPEHRAQKGASETEFSLGPYLAPLEPYKSELLVLEKFFNPFNKDLHGNNWALAVAKESPKGENHPGIAGGITLDRAIGKVIGKNDPWMTLNFAPVEWGNGPYLGGSADGPGMALPSETNPIKAYAAIFAGGAAQGNVPLLTEDRLARDKSLFDHLRGDLGRMRARLGATERAKIDQYVESIREMEGRLSTAVKTSVSCAAPPAPAATSKPSLGTGKAETFAAFQDLTVNALMCGLTHVVLLRHGGDSYPFLGEDGEIGHHFMFHDAGTTKKFTKYFNFHCEQVAALRRRLGEAREGNGTMADNMLLMMINEAGGEHHGNKDEYQLILLGRAGGALKTGRFVSFPKNQRCVSDAFISVANAVGVPMTSFGQMSTGALPGLTA